MVLVFMGLSENNYAVETSGLKKTYGEITAVDSLDLKIKRGELFALLGPNGAGKTTTISMLSCLLKPTSGSAKVMGFDVNKEPYAVKGVLGTSPQETSISERLSIIENLAFIGKLNGLSADEAEKRAEELTKVMGLEERKNSQARKLSGGMRRRLSIMMSLIHNPSVIFLDEPTLGLDPQARRAMWDFISKLKGEKTILLTTHYMEEADFLADNIGIMDEGRIVALGTSHELKTRGIEKTTMIIHAWNITQAASANLLKAFDDISIDKGVITIKKKELDFKQVLDSVHKTGAIIRSAHIKEPSLEDVFINLTGKELRD